MNTEDVRYDSVEDFLRAALRDKCDNPANQARLTRADTPSPDKLAWYGGVTNRRDAADVLRSSWPSGRDKLEQLQSETRDFRVPPSMSRRRRRVVGPSGDHLDIHQVWAGHLDTAWSSSRRMNARGPAFITLVVDHIIAFQESLDIVAWRGAVAIILCRLLESVGYRVRIVVAWCGDAVLKQGGRGQRLAWRITVKDHNQPLTETVVTACLHPALSRMLGKGWSLLNMDCACDSAIAYVERPVTDPGDVLLSRTVSNYHNARTALQATLDKLSSQSLAA